MYVRNIVIIIVIKERQGLNVPTPEMYWAAIKDEALSLCSKS